MIRLSLAVVLLAALPADAVALLSERVRKGSKGVRVPLPMAPIDAGKVSDADLKTVVAWVLRTKQARLRRNARVRSRCSPWRAG